MQTFAQTFLPTVKIPFRLGFRWVFDSVTFAMRAYFVLFAYLCNMRKYIPPVCDFEQTFVPVLTILTASTEDYQTDYIDPMFM